MSEYSYIKYTDLEKYKFYKGKYLNLLNFLAEITQFLDARGILDEFNQHTLNKAEQFSSKDRGRAKKPIRDEDIPIIGD